MAMAMDMNPEQAKLMREFFDKKVQPLNKKAELHLFEQTSDMKNKMMSLLDEAKKDDTGTMEGKYITFKKV